MSTYSFDFQTAFPGVEFQEFDVTLESFGGARARIKSSRTEGGQLRIQLEDCDSDTVAEHRATSLAGHITNVLSFNNTGGHWGSWILTNTSRSGNGPESITQYLNLQERIEYSLGLSPARCEQLKLLLGQRQYAGLVYYEQFRGALGLLDPLSRFMAFYGIVLSICGDVQEKVDAFILSVEPGVATNAPFQQRRSAVPETIYTRLRNQVGHPSRGVPLSATISEMESNLNGLVEAARKLIDRQPESGPLT